MLTVRYCSDCGDERPFERPPCPDGHGSDCPEWMCTDCGLAIVVGDVMPRVAIPQSHAA
jgi:hypothetical protein